MAEYNSEFSSIRKLLEENPRGLTIIEISKKLKINRNSVSKYLELMMIRGDVEQRLVGRAKIYYTSNRVPIANLLDYSSDLILVLNEEGIITQANTSLCRFFDKQSHDIIGKKVYHVLNNEVKPLFDDILNNKLQANPHLEINGHFLKPKIIKTVFLNGERGTTLIMEDITEVEKALRELSESNDRFHNFVRGASSGLLLADSEYKIIETNDAGLRLSGLDREKVIGKHILDFQVDTKDSGRFELYKQIIEGRKSFTTNIVNLPKHLGGKKLIVTVFKAGDGIGMILTDITDIDLTSDLHDKVARAAKY